jgi:hypothetical protein
MLALISMNPDRLVPAWLMAVTRGEPAPRHHVVTSVPAPIKQPKEEPISGGLRLVGNPKKLGWRPIIAWHWLRRGTGPRLADGGSRSNVTGSRPPGCPPFRARLGVLAVPADVSARLPAIGHHLADRKRDPAQCTPGGLQLAKTVLSLPGHRCAHLLRRCLSEER